MNPLGLHRVGHAFLGRTILDGIELSIAPGELVALVGPSGCGKSTLLNIAAGLLAPRQGKVTNRSSRQAVVFQEPRLLPWAKAGDNIAFGLEPLRLSRAETRERVRAAAETVALEGEDLDKYPAQLSGGMRQRVAIARTLAVRPDFVFFDEPFTALDVALKRRMQDIVIDSVATRGLSGLFVTHDLAEATRVAHRIAVLDRFGRGIVGSRQPPLVPGARDDRLIFETVQDFLQGDPLFAHVNDCDERRVA